MPPPMCGKISGSDFDSSKRFHISKKYLTNSSSLMGLPLSMILSRTVFKCGEVYRPILVILETSTEWFDVASAERELLENDRELSVEAVRTSAALLESCAKLLSTVPVAAAAPVWETGARLGLARRMGTLYWLRTLWTKAHVEPFPFVPVT